MSYMDTKKSIMSKIGDLGNWVAKSLRAQTLIRVLGTPFQKFLDMKGGTHKYLTEKAVEILRSDGLTDAAAFFSRWLETIILGNYWADTLWMNSTHHYNPVTQRGLWVWPSTAEQIRNWWNQSLSQWRCGNEDEAVFLLGACLHIVQDCCQPFHSNGIVFQGHQDYEKWADKHKETYDVPESGLYGVSLTASGWVVSNAEFSHGFIDGVTSKDHDKRDSATRLLLPRAMSTSAGFMNFFFENTAAAPALSEPKVAAGKVGAG